MFARGGFGPGEAAALARLRSIRTGDGDPVRVHLVGIGYPTDFTHWLFGTARMWESVTPFVAHRYLKRRGRKRDAPNPGGADPRAGFVLRAAEEAVGGSARAEPVGDPGGRRATEYRRDRSRPGDDGRRRAFG